MNSMTSPDKAPNKNTVHHPNPKRFDYRTGLLRERYVVSIGAIPISDIIHEFMYHCPVTPPNSIAAPSPPISQKDSALFSPKVSDDFKCTLMESDVHSVELCVRIDDMKEEECKNN